MGRRSRGECGSIFTPRYVGPRERILVPSVAIGSTRVLKHQFDNIFGCALSDYFLVATEVTAGLWRVDCRTLDKPHVFITADGSVTHVDAGWPRDEETGRAGLHEAGVGGAAIDQVVVTHDDPDHIGTLPRLTPALAAPLLIHDAEAPCLPGDRLPSWTARHGLGAIHESPGR